MELPVFGAVSEYAARAALAAGMQNKYWEMRTAIFSANQRLTKTVVDKVAMKVGLNLAELNKDMNSEAVTTQLNTIRTLAEKLKLAGTPAFIVAPSDFYQSHNVSKLSFFPGPASGKQLQTFINKAE